MRLRVKTYIGGLLYVGRELVPVLLIGLCLLAVGV